MKTGLRILIIPMAIMLSLITIGLIVLAGMETFKGIEIVFDGNHSSNGHSGAGVHFLQAIDVMLGSLVSLVLLLGIISLFQVVNESYLKKLPKWLHVSDFKHLKVLLWETVLVALVVLFFVQVSHVDGIMDWRLIVIPTSILMLSIGVYFVKK